MERIRELRQEKGLSQAKLAVAAGMDPATLNRLEQGKGNPNLRTLERVANALGVEVADLLGKARRRSPAEPSLDDALAEERPLRYLRTLEEFAAHVNARWTKKLERDSFSEAEFEDGVAELMALDDAYVHGVGTDLLGALRVGESTLPEAEQEALERAKASVDRWHHTMWSAYDALKARGAKNVVVFEKELARRKLAS